MENPLASGVVNIKYDVNVQLRRKTNCLQQIVAGGKQETIREDFQDGGSINFNNPFPHIAATSARQT